MLNLCCCVEKNTQYHNFTENVILYNTLEVNIALLPGALFPAFQCCTLKSAFQHGNNEKWLGDEANTLLYVSLLQDCEDSFYVVDLGRVIHLYDAWMDKLPQVQPFYAVKCNEDPALVKTLAALGTGFDCASKV